MPGFLGSQVLCPSCPDPPYCLDGVITTVKPFNFTINGMLPAYVGDEAVCCSLTVLNSTPSNFIVNGLSIHLVGDLNACGGPTLPTIPVNFFITF
jgi:uncharacterized Zn-binding protein involved in type VI secretion